MAVGHSLLYYALLLILINSARGLHQVILTKLAHDYDATLLIRDKVNNLVESRVHYIYIYISIYIYREGEYPMLYCPVKTHCVILQENSTLNFINLDPDS